MRIFAIVLAALLIIAPTARADDIDSAKAVIQSQADAFGRDDAEGAYAFASPLVREIFPQASIFMEMVRGGYAPVYRHKQFEFANSETTADGTIVQHVGIVDFDGVAWEAVYTVQKQPDGSLKISSCSLKKVGTAV